MTIGRGAHSARSHRGCPELRATMRATQIAMKRTVQKSMRKPKAAGRLYSDDQAEKPREGWKSMKNSEAGKSSPMTLRSGHSESGMVTGEVAIGSLVLALVTAFALALGHIAVAYLEANDAARMAARMAALGEGEGAIKAAVERSFPGASVSVVSGADTVEAVVHAPRKGFSGRLGIDVHASVTAAVEPGVGGEAEAGRDSGTGSDAKAVGHAGTGGEAP